jgi:hypothetical protein
MPRHTRDLRDNACRAQEALPAYQALKDKPGPARWNSSLTGTFANKQSLSRACRCCSFHRDGMMPRRKITGQHHQGHSRPAPR